LQALNAIHPGMSAGRKKPRFAIRAPLAVVLCPTDRLPDCWCNLNLPDGKRSKSK